MKASALLGRPKTSGYQRRNTTHMMANFRRPPFTRRVIPYMLRDPRIRFGLWLIKGPILAHGKLHINTTNAELKAFLTEELTRFWKTSACRVMHALEYGYSGSEVLYTQDKQGLIRFNGILPLHPDDVRPIANNNLKSGMVVKNVAGKKETPLYGMKCLWHVHGREHDPWFGESRLSGAWEPWIDLWKDGGARDVRRLYYYKYAFTGGIMYYPRGSTVDSSGIVVPNEVLANRMLDRLATGGTMTFPTRPGPDGRQQWVYEHPQVNDPPSTILEYINDLRDEEWEGMGIPPEIARAEGTGAYAGRAVPQDAFYSILQEIFDWIVMDANEQIFRPLCIQNFDNDDYEIETYKLIPSDTKKNYFDPPDGEPNPVKKEKHNEEEEQ